MPHVSWIPLKMPSTALWSAFPSHIPSFDCEFPFQILFHEKDRSKCKQRLLHLSASGSSFWEPCPRQHTLLPAPIASLASPSEQHHRVIQSHQQTRSVEGVPPKPHIWRTGWGSHARKRHHCFVCTMMWAQRSPFLTQSKTSSQSLWIQEARQQDGSRTDLAVGYKDPNPCQHGLGSLQLGTNKFLSICLVIP